MNPQSRCRTCLLFALAYTLACVSINYTRAQETIVKVDRGDLKMVITERGVVEAVNRTDVICRYKGTSTIKWVVDDGAKVKKGDKLLELDDAQVRDVIRAIAIQVEQQRANLKVKETELKTVESAAKTDLEIATTYVKLAELEVDQMKKRPPGPTLAKMKVRLEQTKVAIELAELSVKNKGDEESKLILKMAKLEHEKAKLELDEVSQEPSPAQLKKAEIAVLEANRQLENVRRQNQMKVEHAQAGVRASQERLQRAQRNLTDDQEQLVMCVIHAPSDGFATYHVPAQTRAGFGQSLIAAGEPVREGQKLLVINDLTEFQVAMNVDESQISHLKKGQEAKVRVDALPDREAKGKVGSISTIAVLLDPFRKDQKRYDVKVLFDQSLPSLKPGMTAEVRIAGPEAKNVLIVPQSALLRDGRNLVCIVKAGEKTEKRIVTTGISDGKFVEIESGLKEGEEIVLRKSP